MDLEGLLALPDLFNKEVLRRLGPTDLASLAGAGRGFAAAVASTALMQWAKHARMTAYWLFPLCLKDACEHAAGDGNLCWSGCTTPAAPWGVLSRCVLPLVPGTWRW